MRAAGRRECKRERNERERECVKEREREVGAVQAFLLYLPAIEERERERERGGASEETTGACSFPKRK